jgi:RNA polymerase sigma-70 factor (ECF subfamily)
MEGAILQSGKSVHQSIPDAVERLYDDIGERLWRAIFAFTGGQRELADDATAEAFTECLRQWATIRDPAAWVYRVAFRNASRELAHNRKLVPLSYAPELGESQATELYDLMYCLRELSKHQRAAIVLHYQLDLPVADVARVLGISSATAKVHLHRGRRRLRQLLADEGGHDA